MESNPKETEDLVTFAKEILRGKLHFLCSETDQLSLRISVSNARTYSNTES